MVKVYSMMRLFVIGFNASIACGMSVAAGWFMLQFSVNRVWESGFYGGVSSITQAFWWAGLMVLLLAVSTSVATLGYIGGYRWGGHAIFGLSIVFLWSLPAPMSWMACLCAISVALEAAATVEPPAEES